MKKKIVSLLLGMALVAGSVMTPKLSADAWVKGRTRDCCFMKSNNDGTYTSIWAFVLN